ncbi:response regulator transcription factor [Paenibacillus sp.]|uniref:response regulator transcription factor n=1 Tax=Paenibacillus sp. TaxID=58172 RepID=UPI003564EEEE
MYKVLIIEDDNIIGEMLRLYLTEERFIVFRAETGKDGMMALGTFKPDILLLDLMLPDAEGVGLCATFRDLTTAPIIVVSMKTNVTDRIQALTAGADDYLCKPFSMQELKARIDAVLRRSLAAPALPDAVETDRDPGDEIQLDADRRMLIVRGNYVEITYSEYEIMKLFCHNPGKVFSREELINAARGYDSFVNDRAIDVHVTNLRRKMEYRPKEPVHIKTVWGVGYKFIP